MENQEWDRFKEVPNLVREMIINHIKSPSDLAALMEASSVFREDIQSSSESRGSWLYRKILATDRFVQHFNEGIGRIRDFCELYPSFQLIFTNFYKNLYEKVNYNNYRFLEPGSTTPLFVRSGTLDPLWTETLLHKSGQTSPNLGLVRNGGWPFVKRFGHYFLDPRKWSDQAIRDYTGKVLLVLRHFGDELRGFRISFPAGWPSTTNRAMVMQQVLQMMPNLAHLHVTFALSELEESRDVELGVLSDLPNLNTLSLKLTMREGLDLARCPFPGQILRSIQNYIPQLSSLNVREFENFLDLYDPAIHSRFQNLETLSVQMCKRNHIERFLHGFGGRDPVALKRLTIESCNVIETFDVYLFLLEQFSNSLAMATIIHLNGVYMLLDHPTAPTLKQLLKENGSGGEDQDPLQHRFNLPALRALFIVFIYDYMNLSRLADLNNLGYLKLKFNDMQSPGPFWSLDGHTNVQEVPNIFSNLYNLGKSDVWEVVPSINQILVSHREVYEIWNRQDVR